MRATSGPAVPAPRGGKTLIRASRCGTCLGVHGDAPAYWPVCPKHGHWLKELPGQVTAGGYVYGCLAQGCTHTQTLTGRITVTTDQAASAALAIRNDQTEWTSSQLAAFKQLGMAGAPDEDLAVFLHRCQVTGLDPFAKQIRLRKDREKVDGQWQDRWSIETEIDGYRVIASRAAKRDGVTLHYGDPIWYDANEQPHKIWLSADPPAGAEFTVYKDGRPFKGVVAFREFANISNEGNLLANWRTMPAHMIAKCAEALALRMAFPYDFEGIQIQVSGGDGAYAEPQITVTQVSPPAPERREQPRPREEAKLRADIAAEFDRLELHDAEERKVYVYKLANKPHGADLNAHDLRFALDSLKDCEDLAALIDLCAVEAS